MGDKSPEQASRGKKSPTSPKGAKSPKSPKSSEAGAQDPTSETVGILPAQHWVQSAQDHGYDDDAESAVGSLNPSSTASISSSILNYRTLHGRTYHGEVGSAEYWGANDEQQSESLDIKKLLTLGLELSTHVRMFPNPSFSDFADEFPEAEVIGTDISPIQPTWVPPNLKFEIEDCTQPWTFAPDTFDYIHMRWLIGSIPDWSALFTEAFKACRPGGWFESCEPECGFTSDDGTVRDDTALGQWQKFYEEGQRKTGRVFTVVRDGIQRKCMEEAGFVDIQEFSFKIPIGSWPKDPKLKELGQYGQLVLEADTEGYILFMANTLGWTREEIQVYIAHLRREVRSGKIHAYYRQNIIWGRKPESE
ncbi:hypothetical protein SAPIO_CDS6407 [Scedosporium apiospermum]|uniref:Methyltransferase domain-containing protein n=1 Tax=Pseudallescheria apiosperma TaxID=563466 RepID=A0A084G3V0_PSEDA|nr:uncharacterized protein SAPIO_CDS6407 [Scedosporium apiospermum]KEZ42012.1 hypothetical protein SAPIO_CDS6407 [Scedosporium apiospermum]